MAMGTACPVALDSAGRFLGGAAETGGRVTHTVIYRTFTRWKHLG